MTLNYEGSRSSGVKVHSTNRKPMVGYRSDVLCVKHITLTVRKLRMNTAENFNRLIRAQERYGQTEDDRRICDSKYPHVT